MNKFFDGHSGLIKEADWRKNMAIQAPEYIRNNAIAFNKYLADRFSRVAPRYMRSLQHKADGAWNAILDSYDTLAKAAKNNPAYPRWREFINRGIGRLGRYANLAQDAATRQVQNHRLGIPLDEKPADLLRHYTKSIGDEANYVNGYINDLKNIIK